MLLMVLTTVVVVVVSVSGGVEHFTMMTRGRMLRVLGEREHVEGCGSCTVQHLAKLLLLQL